MPFCPEVGMIKEGLSMPWLHPGKIVWLGFKKIWKKGQNTKGFVEGKFPKSWPYIFL